MRDVDVLRGVARWVQSGQLRSLEDQLKVFLARDRSKVEDLGRDRHPILELARPTSLDDGFIAIRLKQRYGAFPGGARASSGRSNLEGTSSACALAPWECDVAQSLQGEAEILAKVLSVRELGGRAVPDIPQ